VLSPVVWLKDQGELYWRNYVALIDVAAENTRLRADIRKAQAAVTLAAEERAELERLRELLRLDVLRERPGFAARVIAKRFGPQAVLKTFTVDKGFLDGAIVGTPVVNDAGVVGRILRAAPHTATVLMLTDPGFRLAVISQDSRTPGILTGGAGHQKRLEVAYVAQNARIGAGEALITAGVDGAFPKGIPVGTVTQVMPGNEILFLQVHAKPAADLERLEEVILLQTEGSGPPLLEGLPNPVEPDPLLPPGSHFPPQGARGALNAAPHGEERPADAPGNPESAPPPRP
jgi:rod shape-determining protein MreC